MQTTRAASPTDVATAPTLTATHLEELEITTMPTPQPTPQHSPSRGPLFTQRATLLLLLAVLLGALVGGLTFAAAPVLATAALAGLVAAGGVLLGGHQLIE